MIDEKFKDASPKRTIERIKGILQNYHISAAEEWRHSGVSNCYAIKVYDLEGSFQSIGKGVTEELCLASGYAEFMERLQAGYIERRMIRDNLLVYKDAVKMSTDEAFRVCKPYLNSIVKSVRSLFATEVSDEFVFQSCIAADNSEDSTILMLPFYNASTDSMTYYPQRFIRYLYSTNGLAAGNTVEEAIVQSFSEIVERNHLISILFNGIVPPNVPDDYLKHYRLSWQTIQEVRSHGYELLIKDCSLGDGYPLLAAVAINKDTHAYHVHFGAHPVFEIALERSLTEMFQGRSIDNVATNKHFLRPGKPELGNLIKMMTYGFGEYPLEFFYGTPSYEFKPFRDYSGKTNLELLQEIKHVLDKNGYQMLVRNNSHLGFTAVRVIIPGFSELFSEFLLTKYPLMQQMEKHKKSFAGIDKADIASKTEYRLLLQNELGMYGNDYPFYPNITGIRLSRDVLRLRFPARMLFAYLEWECGSKKKANSMATSAASYSNFQEDRDYLAAYDCINEHLLNGIKLDDTIAYLSHFYDDAILNELQYIIANGKNPFERFLLHCVPENCACCKYRDECRAPGDWELTKKVNAAVQLFDNERAFRNLKELFSSL